LGEERSLFNRDLNEEATVLTVEVGMQLFDRGVITNATVPNVCMLNEANILKGF